jgi:Ser/Thr protein kinase RdoA (MazF antagonist)
LGLARFVYLVLAWGLDVALCLRAPRQQHNSNSATRCSSKSFTANKKPHVVIRHLLTISAVHQLLPKSPFSATRDKMASQDGLEWASTTFGLQPRWTKEPEIAVIAVIARKHLGLPTEVQVDVVFYAQGAFNKLYKITASDSSCLMRVSLPVHPRLKTESEVATINFVRRETEMPAPRVLAFSSDNQNELGFEWILMEMMAGVALRSKWRSMPWSAKEDVVKKLVKYQAELSGKAFQETGNLFEHAGESQSFAIGPIVSLIFFWGDHLTHDVARGPFKNDYDWLQTRLAFVITDQERILENTEDEDDIEDAEFAKELAQDLSSELRKVFPEDTESDHIKTILFHDDLSMLNILVGEEGNLTAVIDWECVSAVPAWRACQHPQLLEGRTREEEPLRTQYMAESDDEDGNPSDSDALDNEGVNALYWEHLLEYEQTQLRKLFVKEMEIARPEWVATMNSNTLKSDFEKAIHNCDNGWSFKVVRRWLEAYKQGRRESLAAKLIE